MASRPEGNIGKYPGRGSETAWGNLEEADPWDLFLWPQYSVTVNYRKVNLGVCYRIKAGGERY
jgi:hypothetical protein